MTDIEAEDEYVISLNNKRIINFKLGTGTWANTAYETMVYQGN